MVQIFLIIMRALASGPDARPNDDERWRADPLAHPSVAAMSQRELADLPMGWRLPARRR